MKVQTNSAPCSARPCPHPAHLLSGSEVSLPGGVMAHLHYKYSLLSSEAEEYRKRPLPLQVFRISNISCPCTALFHAHRLQYGKQRRARKDNRCMQESSMRACVYNSSLNNAMPVRLQVGLYVVYVLDWLSVFGRDQLLVLRLEDHAADRRLSMHRVFQFLHLGPLSVQKEAEISKRPASNTRRLADKNLGPMLPLTRELLSGFYSPFNRKLADVLQDDAFLWKTHSQPGVRNS
ncbi:carbohydrate sulfotransferase 15-like [Salminus brasiliensis]|uniref:carbohydrate sulfotransferase 15-like n=1 Tax=Salminus brasiliensis TaxID=930266 RepID=UPI003B835E55